MEIYVPDIYQKSIYTIDYSKLLSRGIKCLLFDLDNTLVPPRSKEKNEKAKDLFISLKQKGFKVFIFSNSPKRRVDMYKEYFNVDGVYMALKPFERKFQKFIHDYNLKTSELAIIGDQLVTDVALGKKVGIMTILVNPITDEDHIFSKVNRIFERKKLKELKEKNLFDKGRFYD